MAISDFIRLRKLGYIGKMIFLMPVEYYSKKSMHLTFTIKSGQISAIVGTGCFGLKWLCKEKLYRFTKL